MKNVFFILTSGIFGLFPFFTARAQTCAEIVPEPKVEYYTSYGNLYYDFDKSRLEITREAKKYGILEQGLFASGLALADVNWELSINTLSKNAGKETCVIPMIVKFYIGYSSPRIYIDRLLKPGSCEYDVVLRHEQTHQQINKVALDYFVPLFKDAVADIIRSVPPVKIKYLTKAEVNHATDRLTQEYTKKITPLIDIFKKELSIEQGKLDNPENYELENTLCRD